MQRILFALLAAACALALPASAQQQVQRAPLDWFLGYDDFRSVSMSPSGRHLAVLRRDEVGDVLMIVDLETRQSRAIQRARADQSLQISYVDFASDSRVVFILTQRNRVTFTRGTMIRRANVDDGFETNSRIYASNLDGTNLIPLYDPTRQGFDAYVDAGLVSTLPHDDNNVLLIVPTMGGVELRKVNVDTGEQERVDTGTLHTFSWVVDVNGTPVLRQDAVGNGRGYAWLRRGPGQRSWTEIARFRGAEGVNSAPEFQPLGAAVQPGQVFVSARREGSDTNGLYILDASTGQYTETVQTSPAFDISGAEIDTERGIVQAACWWAQKWTCEPKDQAFGERWTAINQALGDNVNVFLSDQSDDGNRWLVYTFGPQDLGTYYIYNHQTRSLNVAFRQRPAANAALLPTERTVEYTTSDGQRQWGYLWVPPGVTNARNLPLIVIPHGGPEGRDVFGTDFMAHAVAAQGYAVFQPNFRGGGGFGRAFVEAGHRQWGQRMQQDVADGTRYLIEQGIADPNRTCIAGWSYGGYVAFTASFMNTDLFKCSVAGAGVSDLRAMLRWVRTGSRDNDVNGGGGGGQQSPVYQYWTDAIGDPSRDDAALDQFSAAQNASRVTIPLLIIHGDEDVTVPIQQSQLMQQAMERAGKPTRLIVLQDADHNVTPIQGDAMRTVLTESVAFFNQHIGPGVAPGSQ
jgi:dienelactone hydrolase